MNKIITGKAAGMAMKLFQTRFCLLLTALLICGCTSIATSRLDDLDYNKPVQIHTFPIPESSVSREYKDTRPSILKGFPFISYRPAENFAGKYPPEFYSQFKSTAFNAEFIKQADFWKMRHNQRYYDILYIMPLWVGDLYLPYDDLMKNIAYSYNISELQMEILEKWIKEGGILWIESAIYVSPYDMKINRFNEKSINDIVEKLKGMSIFGHKISLNVLKADSIDEFNVVKIQKEIVPDPAIKKVLKGSINKLLLEQTDSRGLYFTVQGTEIVSSGGNVYASVADYGKGKIITLAPFDYRNTYFDGETLRLDLLSWLFYD